MDIDQVVCMVDIDQVVCKVTVELYTHEYVTWLLGQP